MQYLKTEHVMDEEKETLVSIFTRAMENPDYVGSMDLDLFTTLYAKNEHKDCARLLDYERELLTSSPERIDDYLNVVDQFRAYASRATIFEDMTGLYKKSYFDKQLAVENGRIRRIDENPKVRDDGSDFEERSSDYGSVLAIDLVGLKKVNDSLGHKAGDDLIKAVAKELLEFCQRSGDVCARVGGDEFAILLPRTDIYQSLRMINRINAAFNYSDGLPVEIEVDGKIEVIQARLSIGVYEIKGHLTPDENFKMADINSYDAKASQYAILGWERRI